MPLLPELLRKVWGGLGALVSYGGALISLMGGLSPPVALCISNPGYDMVYSFNFEDVWPLEQLT